MGGKDVSGAVLWRKLAVSLMHRAILKKQNR